MIKSEGRRRYDGDERGSEGRRRCLLKVGMTNKLVGTATEILVDAFVGSEDET